MRAIPLAAASLLALASSAGAQMMVPPPQVQRMAATAPTYYVAPPTSYVAPARPAPSPARRYARGTVLNGFSSTGGIGTTPYLGNTLGIGSYQTNYDRPRRVMVPARRFFWRRGR
jgi:hypothetical protein